MPGPVDDAYTGDAGSDPLQDSQSTVEGQDVQSQGGGQGDAAVAAADAAATDANNAPATQEDGDGEQDGNNAAAEPAQIEGTPFKDQAALVEGYKNIQRLVANKDTQIENLQRQVSAAVDAVRKAFGPKPEPAAPTKLPTGQELWDAFAKDPGGTIQKFVDAKLQTVMQSLDPRLKGVEDRVGGYEQRSTIQQFMMSHPDVDTAMEKEIAEILRARPALMKLENFGLDVAYDAVTANRYRAGKQRTSTENAVAGARSVAGIGGKKTSVPAQKKPDQDVFDQVLDLDKQERELFNLGRKP